MSSAESTVIEADKQVQTRHLPGDLAMWCFILAELLAFLLLLGSMAFARGHWSEMFSAGIATLHPEAGLVNTLILLTGSYFAANAVKRTAAGDQRALSRGFVLAALCGLAYVAIKITEYGILFGDGYNLRTDTFYFFYFFTTFFHMAHVLIGMAILLVVAQRSRAGHYANQEKVRMAGESAASYWHMVDLVWLVLFPLLYVLP
ncbi:cytochrome c oxidase subunit 3 [Halopseudomonas bauzanensis]|uniref:Nitric oxide reductase NorE protein n=1 Tax=Halopseudomonas bauzanensis TaxID=653930 RepID=A0A1H9QIU7_9GAMM|nr:cytochrome c oxidase subunit 3 [Halopseudomonas bauzanensis]SER60491.1 nitric oxide reductase NorE protein [Halopseudomonas bauzanensis]SFL65442.1 nitric oxide reductase NorE protein [Halopseudomonas bauzanensis]